MSVLNNYFPDDWIYAVGEDNLLNCITTVNTELLRARTTEDVLPLAGDPLLFQTFRETPFNSVKIVVLGQDPYHDGSFNGLAFGNGSKKDNRVKGISPSLRNILSEVERTEGSRPNPNLYGWAAQGVLLLNTAHTVIRGEAGSHLSMWSPFTTLIINALNSKQDIVWLLWGTHAKSYGQYIINKSHVKLEAGHPSPLNTSHPFVGCDCFKDCNNILKAKDYEPIIWG